MLTFDDSYFLGETRDGFYIEPMMKCAWAAQLEVMCVIKQICEKYDIPYFAYYGTLLGTIRHKGFIPWDDDLDFFMPRDDYEKLYKLWNNDEQERYKLSKPGKDTVDRNLFITIRDSETTLIKPYQQDLDMVHGVVLDILPLDGYPSSSLSRKWQVIHALIYSLFCAQTVPEKHGGLMAVGSKILLGIFRGKDRTRGNSSGSIKARNHGRIGYGN